MLDENVVEVRAEVYNNTDDVIEDVEITHRILSNGEFFVSKTFDTNLGPMADDKPASTTVSKFHNMHEIESRDDYTAEARVKGGWFVDENWIKASD